MGNDALEETLERRDRHMKRIENVAVIGMGALGLLFGDLLDRDAALSVGFIVDEARSRRYAGEPILINGERRRFRYLPAGATDAPADLVLFAVKATALEGAMEDAAGYIGPDTVVLSLLNGITSEGLLERRFGRDRVVYCVAQGMDATRQERTLSYSRPGQLCVGLPDDRPRDGLDALTAVLRRAKVPHTVEADILHRMWSKFMLNVGVNQVVMVREGNYGTVQAPGEAREQMIAAMREVIALSAFEGVPVTEADLKDYVDLIDTLSPDGMPSMRQDGLAHRRSEVELFSGTVCRLAEKHGLDVPVNRRLYETIRAMEAAWEKG